MAVSGGFFQRVYQIVKRIPPGKVATYGLIAAIVDTHDGRRVGQALHANSDPGCPCHRVVFADGSLAPGYAFSGPKEQQRRLQLEGVTFTKERKVQLTKHLWKPGRGGETRTHDLTLLHPVKFSRGGRT
ncbi:MAG: MGMT family protein [Patescibacteria group bacterium]